MIVRTSDGWLTRPVACGAAALLVIASCSGKAAAAPDDDLDEQGEVGDEPEDEEAPAEVAGDSDHDRVVRHAALGFLGTRWVPAAAPDPAGAVVFSPEGNATVRTVDDEITVPLFGLRYWFNSLVGAELGIGLNLASGSETIQSPNPDATLSTTVERDAPSTTAFALRLGIPLSIYSHSHYRLLLVPEIGAGYTRAQLDAYEVSTTGEALDLRLTGFVFGVGGRVGAEVDFGFIGVPDLSLQTTWGVRFESRRRTGRIGDAETVRTETTFGSSWYRAPWQVLTGSFAVLYYL